MRYLVALSALVLAGAGLTPAPKAKPTYAADVAPILNRHCAPCHREGEVAPFSLIGYDNAKKWATMIAVATGQSKMPPWKPVHGYGEFLDENRLTATQIATLRAWAEAGAPRGDRSQEPPTPVFSNGWALGKPDVVLTLPKPYQLAADGPDVYRHFVTHEFTQTTWVRGIDVRPGNRRIVHHVIAFLDRTGQSTKLEANTHDGQPGYSSFGGPGFVPSGTLGGWAPGQQSRFTPEGTAFRVPAGTRLVLQVHYHPDGKAETDQTKVALYTTTAPNLKEMRLKWDFNLTIAIPPGAKAHKEVYDETVHANATIYGVMPHMHLLGKSMKAWVTQPDGTVEPLVFIDDWDFNWQLTYMLKRPLHVEKGAKLHVEAVYDNSADNPNNPNQPPKRVTFGEQTTDEMFLFILAYTLD